MKTVQRKRRARIKLSALVRSEGRCVLCGERFNESDFSAYKEHCFAILRGDPVSRKKASDLNLNQDHMIPQSLGGRSSRGNIHIVHKTCNAMKSNKIWI